jgi:hypothetical protein
VRVTSAAGCTGTLEAAVQVVGQADLALRDVDPAFVPTADATAITVRAAAGSFTAAPRLYLSAADAVAVALRATVRVDDGTVTAVVPAGTPAGQYDLVAVTAEGAVGVLSAGLTVTEGEPPVIAAVEPSSLDADGAQQARIVGEGFDAADVRVSLSCLAPDAAEPRTADATVVPGTLGPTGLVASFPAGDFAAGSVCVVTVANADGAFARWSALSIRNPAQNLNGWAQQPSMVEARRAPALVAGRPTPASRFLYAIGGDRGAPNDALASVEAASVDAFGRMGAWTTLPNALPARRTLAAVTRVGRFVYLLGGREGGAATRGVLRAEILDPLATPAIDDVSLALDPSGRGLGPGTWSYRVSAVFPAGDASNPGGESLPGEVFVARLPQVRGLRVRLGWAPVAGASGYRVYRTAGQEAELLAEVDGDTFTDDGRATQPGRHPLPPGALGVWHAAPDLGTAREAAAAVAVSDGAGGAYLYVFGGRDASGRPLDTYEFTAISGDGRAGPFTPGSRRLAVARAELAAVAVTNADTSAVAAGDAWIFVGPGRSAAGFARNVEAGRVQAGGDLGAFVATDNASGDLAGYGAGQAHGFLFAFGGRGGAPSDAGLSADLCHPGDAGCAGGPPDPPDLRSWNNLGVRLGSPRAYMGSAQESAFFFLAGGTDGRVALRTVEAAVQ